MLHYTEISDLLRQGESLTVEFKSDVRGLSDRELIAAIVGLANTEGGDLLIGVEDDGTVTGLHPTHENTTSLSAFIGNKTIPSLAVRLELLEADGAKLVRISVPKSRQLVSTSEGLLQRRRLMADGKPESVPFYPHEFVQRQSALGLLDPSAMVLEDIRVEDLSPLERHRIREAIRRYGGDQSLLPLADEELDGALGLTRQSNGQRRPTLTGLLLLGHEAQLRQWLPAHEVAFQVLDRTNVRLNEFFHKPLLQTFEDVEQLFRARVVEHEMQVGLFRVPVPNYDRIAFREAFVNALVHRDYAQLGAVHVRLDDDGLTVSNPGGFVEGVTLQNLLVVDPRSRNPLLADVVKRIGLAERTGRGIDRIYQGMLRYGRPAPDYSLSSPTSVAVTLPDAEADFAFLKMILRYEEQTNAALPIDSLVILSRLRQERRLTTLDLTVDTQKPEATTRSALERLMEAGVVEPHGIGRGRSYTLSANVYRTTGRKAAYVRQTGFSDIQQEQMILSYIAKHGSIRRGDVMDLCRLSKHQAYRLLKKLEAENRIQQNGKKRNTFYTRLH